MTRDKRPQLSGQNKTDLMPNNASCKRWDTLKVLPYFRKMENDHDFQDEFHGNDGPVPVRRYKPDEWLPHSVAFHQACVNADFRADPDQNHPKSTGVSPRARNTIDGVRVAGNRV